MNMSPEQEEKAHKYELMIDTSDQPILLIEGQVYRVFSNIEEAELDLNLTKDERDALVYRRKARIPITNDRIPDYGY